MEGIARENLAGEALTADEFVAELDALRAALLNLGTAENKVSSADEILNRVDFVSEKTVFFKHKAQLLLIKGDVNDFMARFFWNEDKVRARGERSPGSSRWVPSIQRDSMSCPAT